MEIRLTIALIQLRKILNNWDNAEKEWKEISWSNPEKDKDAVSVCKNTHLTTIKLIEDLRDNYSDVLEEGVLAELEENLKRMKLALELLETYEQGNY